MSTTTAGSISFIASKRALLQQGRTHTCDLDKDTLRKPMRVADDTRIHLGIDRANYAYTPGQCRRPTTISSSFNREERHTSVALLNRSYNVAHGILSREPPPQVTPRHAHDTNRK